MDLVVLRPSSSQVVIHIALNCVTIEPWSAPARALLLLIWLTAGA
jgi:hypothetical protein